MNKETASQVLLSVIDYFEKNAAAYSSWGSVAVVQAAVRIDDQTFVFSDEKIRFSECNPQHILVGKTDEVMPFAAIFSKRKKIEVILKTRQEYAQKVRSEIPPILDDQAQLLGVSVRIADEKNIAAALKNRFAAITNSGDSYCIGQSVEDAFIAAQLLEKTSKVFVEAQPLGGAKPINRLEAWFMQQYFLLKYAKEANKNRLK